MNSSGRNWDVDDFAAVQLLREEREEYHPAQLTANRRASLVVRGLARWMPNERDVALTGNGRRHAQGLIGELGGSAYLSDRYRKPSIPIN